MMDRLSVVLFVLVGLLLGTGVQSSTAAALKAEPGLKVIIERVSQALGGAKGGRKVLSGGEEVDFVFRRTVRDSLSRQTIDAVHRYVRTGGGKRSRLDVRVDGDTGVDSATVIDGEEAWLIAEGRKHASEADAVRSRLLEFAPERMFSVPLSLGAEASSILGDADLELSRSQEGGKPRIILSGAGADDRSTRIVLDGESYRPIEVAFDSLSGTVVYRYSDYREVVGGLVLPFVREFHRNGIAVSRTEVLRLGFRVPDQEELFDPSGLELRRIETGSSK